MGTVLVVEDEPDLQEVISIALRTANHQVLRAETAKKAIRACSEHCGPIDAMLCDVCLPDSTADKLVSSVLKIHPEVKILIMSGDAEVETRAEACSAIGKYPVILKPFELTQVVHRITEMCAQAEKS